MKDGLNIMKYILILILAVICCACTKSDIKSDNSKLKVTASIVPLADIAKSIGGDKVEVTFIIPPGANPHVFEPSPSQLANLSKSDVFIFVGLGLEFWKDKFVGSVSKSSLEMVEVSDGLDILEDPHEHGEACNHHEHSHSLGNPHVWLSPKRVIEFVPKIESAFCKIKPQNSSYYKENTLKLNAELEELDKECRQLSKNLKNKKFLSQHASWVYFAEDYGFEQSGAIEEFPGKEPSPAHMKKVIDLAKKTGTKVIITDKQLSPKAAEVVAEDGNLKVVVLDPMGNQDMSYIELMRHNIAKIKEAYEI